MSGPTTVRDGATVTKDPSDILIYVFDWDAKNLAASVIINSQNTTVVGLSGDVTTTPMVITDQNIMAGSRKVQVRLSAGAVGSLWRVSNFIQTNESPDQRK